MYIGEDIKKQREAKANNIIKGFSNSDDLLEKAHNHGEVHSNGKWYWESSANRGKGDWRTIKRAGKSASTTSSAKPQPKAEDKKEDDKEQQKTFSIKKVASRLQALQKEGKMKKGWSQKIIIDSFTANIRTGEISSVAPYTKGFYTFTSGGNHGRANMLQCEGKKGNGYKYTYGGIHEFFVPNYGDI